MSDNSVNFPIHECIFKGNIKKLSQLIRTNDVTQKDKHGLLIILNKNNINHRENTNLFIFPLKFDVSLQKLL